MKVLGRCFGFRVMKRSKKVEGTDSPIVQILIEDDENWIPKDVWFDVAWLDDLIETALRLKAGLRGGATQEPPASAQIRALRFVRNLTPQGIDKVIADVEAGRVKL